MFRKVYLSFVVLVLSTIAIAFFVSCGGTSGGDKDFAGTQFVADAAGSIIFKTLPTTIQTSQTAPFLVDVKDASGNPVPAIEVSCDTEQGLALIEPTTGHELTDNFGSISGIIGCESPGSFQIGCRLPIGANKRIFSRITCTGEVPDGFTGFPGAGGGGLGGGTQGSDDGGPGGISIEGFGIIGTSLTDGEEDNTFAVDTAQSNNCGSEQDDIEPFGDAVVTFDFINETNSTVSCTDYSITVPDVGTFGPINIGAAIVGGVAPNGGEASASVLLAAAQGDGTKTWAGGSTVIENSTGFKNITFTFSCKKDTGDSADEGEEFTLSESVGLNFFNVNRCTEGGGSGSGNTLSPVSLTFEDGGVDNAAQADVVATACGGGETETITNTTFVMTVDNGLSSDVTIESYTVTIDTVGSPVTVSKTAQISVGTDKTFTGNIALGGASKTTLDGTAIGQVGGSNITVELSGTTTGGTAVTVSASSNISFTEVDNCS